MTGTAPSDETPSRTYMCPFCQHIMKVQSDKRRVVVKCGHCGNSIMIAR